MVTLVTGVTGLVGNNVVRGLLAEGQSVRVLARERSDPRPLAGLEVEIARGDVRDRDAVERALAGADCVVHAAADVRIGWTGLERSRAINVEGARNVALAARPRRADGSRVEHRRVGTGPDGCYLRRGDAGRRRRALSLCRYQARSGAGGARAGDRGAGRVDRQPRVHDRTVRLEAVVGADAVAGGARLGPVRAVGREQLLRRARRDGRHSGGDRPRAPRGGDISWPARR